MTEPPQFPFQPEKDKYCDGKDPASLSVRPKNLCGGVSGSGENLCPHVQNVSEKKISRAARESESPLFNQIRSRATCTCSLLFELIRIRAAHNTYCAGSSQERDRAGQAGEAGPQ